MLSHKWICPRLYFQKHSIDLPEIYRRQAIRQNGFSNSMILLNVYFHFSHIYLFSSLKHSPKLSCHLKSSHKGLKINKMKYKVKLSEINRILFQINFISFSECDVWQFSHWLKSTLYFMLLKSLMADLTWWTVQLSSQYHPVVNSDKLSCLAKTSKQNSTSRIVVQRLYWVWSVISNKYELWR